MTPLEKLEQEREAWLAKKPPTPERVSSLPLAEFVAWSNAMREWLWEMSRIQTKLDIELYGSKHQDTSPKVIRKTSFAWDGRNE